MPQAPGASSGTAGLDGRGFGRAETVINHQVPRATVEGEKDEDGEVVAVILLVRLWEVWIFRDDVVDGVMRIIILM